MDARFTPEQILDRWEAQREIKNTMVRMISQDCLFRREHEAYAEYWSTRDDVCLGVNEGYYRGAEAVQSYYKAIEQRTKLESALIQKKYPNRLADKTGNKVYGVGSLRYKAMEIPVVEIAADGQTAKAIYHIHGSNTRLTASGQVSYWERSWVACDFILEKEQWKVWHMLYVTDIDHPCGVKWTDPAPAYAIDPIYAELDCDFLPTPTVVTKVREQYHASRRLTPPPEYPLPYETFSETFSYGI